METIKHFDKKKLNLPKPSSFPGNVFMNTDVRGTASVVAACVVGLFSEI